MAWKNLTSSNIKRTRYNKEDKFMEVEFNNGCHYEYKDVPESVFNDFVEADSPGRAFASEIKGQYVSRNLNDKEGGR
ncbi:KTSC domain-containing protein [Candidatus Pacearchaeota archaeon]|nr:KTSC domain-containing protein [Candidatus Pacearchaeota archaeon]